MKFSIVREKWNDTRHDLISHVCMITNVVLVFDNITDRIDVHADNRIISKI